MAAAMSFRLMPPQETSLFPHNIYDFVVQDAAVTVKNGLTPPSDRDVLQSSYSTTFENVCRFLCSEFYLHADSNTNSSISYEAGNIRANHNTCL
jgi:hypothetical protein